MKTTQSKFAEMQGVSKQRVGQWIRAGTITLGEDRKINVELAKKELERNLDFRRREDWEVGSGRRIQPKKIKKSRRSGPVAVYRVIKPFEETIDGEKFLIPGGTRMVVYGRKGSKQIEVAFFPGSRE